VSPGTAAHELGKLLPRSRCHHPLAPRQLRLPATYIATQFLHRKAKEGYIDGCSDRVVSI